MGDIVVTVPRERWEAWLAEGDLPGEPWSGREHRFWMGWRKVGPWEAGDRVYVVALGRVQGYAPLVRVERDPLRGYALVRHGGAVGMTIPEEVRGFRGVRARWWDRVAEVIETEWFCEGEGRGSGIGPSPRSPLVSCGGRN